MRGFVNEKTSWCNLCPEKDKELAYRILVSFFIARIGYTSLAWEVTSNTCGATYRNYLKVLTPYVNTDLQQPHIYFDAQRYTSTHRYGY